MTTESTPTVVLPFFRAGIALSDGDQALFDCNTGDEAFLTALRHSPAVFRHNLQRLLVAAECATALSAPIALAEGWHHNTFAPGAATLTGAEAGARTLKLLQDRNLSSFSGEIYRLDQSCCTWEEIACVAKAFPGAKIVGVTSSPCPSARRAARVMRIQLNQPIEVLSTCPLNPKQQAVFDACAVSPGVGSEAINWVVHLISEIERIIFRPTTPLEMRLAKRLRQPQK